MADDKGFPDFGPGAGGSGPGGGFRKPNFAGAKIELPQGKGWIWGAAAVVVLLVMVGVIITGRGGLVEVDDTEVAVVMNYFTGEKELVATPGYKIFMPFAEQAYLFDKSPNKFLMEGDRDLDANHVRRLTVRANDGSNFWFETLEIQYQLIAAEAALVLADSGPGDAFKQNWVRAYARSVLRDVFGQYSAEEMADPTTFSQATPQARERLNDLLKPHGIRIIQVITPKPRFEDRYEQAIQDRKVANQSVERLKAQGIQLEKERDRRLGEVERDKATEFEQLLGTLEAERIGAERDQVRLEKEADAYKIKLVADGRAAENRMLQEAVALETKARKEAEGLRARVEALAARGDILVREALAEKLAQIVFNVVPYRRDPSPTRIEHLGAVPAVGGSQQ